MKKYRHKKDLTTNYDNEYFMPDKDNDIQSKIPLLEASLAWE